MKKIFLMLLAVVLFAGWMNAQQPVLTNYSYKFKINGLKDTVCYMGFHFGEKKYVRDTARVNSKGEVEFKGKDTIKAGMYLFVLPNKRWFEFVVNEPTFSIETDTTDFINKMKIKGSKENTLWIDYLKFMQVEQVMLEDMKMKKAAITDKSSKEYKDIEAMEKAENDKIDAFRNKIIKDNPTSMVTMLFKAMKEIEIPEAPRKQDGSIDSSFSYRYYRAHYFDNIDLTDDRILRTPIFESKLMYFLEKVIPQNPDTIMAEVDKLVAKVKPSPDMFKFAVHTITYNYERSQIMCMDAVFVHMVETYYKPGLCDWVDQKTLEKMIERADKLRPVLCNKQVKNIILPDTNMVWHSLYDLKGEVTILYFWDANCSHCKKSTPVLKELYETFLKPKGIEVFAVEGELETDDWKKYLHDNKLPWINVSDNPEINQHPEKYILEMGVTDLNSLNFRHNFDLVSYPVIFVLDKDKRIIGKKLGVEQLKDFIERYLKRQGGK